MIDMNEGKGKYCPICQDDCKSKDCMFMNIYGHCMVRAHLERV